MKARQLDSQKKAKKKKTGNIVVVLVLFLDLIEARKNMTWTTS